MGWDGGGELSIKATLFGKLLTLYVREDFKWYLRNQPWYRDVENLETVLQICAQEGDTQKKNLP